MTIKFVKMHGAGNDFIMIDDREERFPDGDQARLARIGARRTGIGSEGIILVRRSSVADFAMRFFNPDGSEADLCGNGARCVAAFAYAIGAAKERRMRFETRAGGVCAEISAEGEVTIAMPPIRDLDGDFVVAGVPHFVVPVDDLKAVDVDGEGRRWRYAERFAPAGTNVDFVHFESTQELSIRTYERGVEAESGACGTGSVASAVIGVMNYGMRMPVRVKTAGGYVLTVGGSVEALTLTGPVEVVYRGEFVI